MFYLSLCGLKVKVDNIYPEIENISGDYIIPPQTPDITITISPEDIEKEKALYPENSLSHLEVVVVMRKLTRAILPFKVFLMHSVALKYQNRAYLFAGKSGAGKSTHTELWQKFIPQTEIINDDKPLIRLEEDGFYVWGTPWLGKESRGKNDSAKIHAVCFIEQSKDISITPLSPQAVLSRIFNQVEYIKEPALNTILIELIDEFIKSVPFYLLKCDISKKSVDIAFNTITREAKYEKQNTF